MPSTCLRRLSDTCAPSRTEGYATLQAKITENIICDCPSRGPVTRPASCCNLPKKNQKSYSRCPPSIRGSVSMIPRLGMTQAGRRECSTLYCKFLHQMVKALTHNSVIVASYTRMTINMYPTIRRIRLIMSISLQRRNTSIPSNLLTIPEMMEFFSAEIVQRSRQFSKISCIAHMKEYSFWHCGGMVSSQLYLFCVMLFLHILYAIKTLISDRVLELNPYSTSIAR